MVEGGDRDVEFARAHDSDRVDHDVRVTVAEDVGGLKVAVERAEGTPLPFLEQLASERL